METKATINTAPVLAVCLILLLVCIGCSSDPIMRERFKDNKIVIATDNETGNRYIIKHDIGDNYTVKPLPKAN